MENVKANGKANHARKIVHTKNKIKKKSYRLPHNW